MQALHSSSALACNVFDYWRGRDTSPLARALEIEAPICSIAFERKFPTGLRGKAPNLDVVLTPASGPAVAIESKFLEPYGSKGKKSGFKPKYFPRDRELWTEAGFPKCQAAATAASARKDQRLNAAQLLKHILGLARMSSPWSLLYLWYDPTANTDETHSSELRSFSNSVSGDRLLFRAISYQTLFKKLVVEAGQNDVPYIEYLRDRYFPHVAI